LIFAVPQIQPLFSFIWFDLTSIFCTGLTIGFRPWHARGRGFDPPWLHQFSNSISLYIRTGYVVIPYLWDIGSPFCLQSRVTVGSPQMVTCVCGKMVETGAATLVVVEVFSENSILVKCKTRAQLLQLNALPQKILQRYLGDYFIGVEFNVPPRHSTPLQNSIRIVQLRPMEKS